MLLGTCHQDLPDNAIDCLAIHAKEQGYINFSVGVFSRIFGLVIGCLQKKRDLLRSSKLFSDDEAARLIQYLWKDQDLRGLGLILMFQTGMRVGEFAALRWGNVLDGKIIITATEETWKDPETGKKKCEVVAHAKTDAGNSTMYLPEQAEKTKYKIGQEWILRTVEIKQKALDRRGMKRSVTIVIGILFFASFIINIVFIYTLFHKSTVSYTGTYITGQDITDYEYFVLNDNMNYVQYTQNKGISNKGHFKAENGILKFIDSNGQSFSGICETDRLLIGSENSIVVYKKSSSIPTYININMD